MIRAEVEAQRKSLWTYTLTADIAFDEPDGEGDETDGQQAKGDREQDKGFGIALLQNRLSHNAGIWLVGAEIQRLLLEQGDAAAIACPRL